MHHYPLQVEINLGSVLLSGEIDIPEEATGVILFSHGSGSNSKSPRNLFVSERLKSEGLGTFLFDLLTPEEDVANGNRFNIDLITERLLDVTHWFRKNFGTHFNLGYFGASTGAASAFRAAAKLGDYIQAVVSRGGRPDLSMNVLPFVEAPTLLIVGSHDEEIIEFNENAFDKLKSVKKIVFIEGASHLFEEPGKLEEVADYTAGWFKKHLKVNEESSVYR